MCTGSMSLIGYDGKVIRFESIYIYKYKKQLQKIEKKVGMVYQKAYKQG